MVTLDRWRTGSLAAPREQPVIRGPSTPRGLEGRARWTTGHTGAVVVELPSEVVTVAVAIAVSVSWIWWPVTGLPGASGAS